MTCRTILIACLLMSVARAGTPETGHDVDREIAWARATWARDLRGVRFQSPTAKLLAWVAPGTSLQVWAFSPAHACTPMELRRAGDAEHLVGRQALDPAARSGADARSYRELSIGAVFSSGTGAESPPYGALSRVDAETARFDGEPVVLYAECVGPVRWLKCESGGERPCVGCTQVELVVVEANASYSEGGLQPGRRRITCQEPCPPRPPNPSLARLDRLQSQVQVWRPRNQSPAETPSLHRTLAGCLRAHFASGEQPPTTVPSRP